MISNPITRALQQFTETFTSEPEALFYAPGRVNLIGEHTDYNNGFVLPCAIEYGTYMAIGCNNENTFRVLACDINQESSDWSLLEPIKHDVTHTWANYLRGVHHEFIRRGFNIQKGLNIAVAGNVPQGAGLSSSASFSVAFATALSQINAIHLQPVEIAKICQAAENNFVGCHCGIMDQLISAEGKAGQAVLIDCNDLSLRQISMPENLKLMIIDSKVKRGLVESEYNLRREQCEAAAEIMNVASLRDADVNILQQYKSQLSDEVFRRARHVITENTRTLAAAEALQTGDIKMLSQLMAESHASMRDDFQITVPPIDLLVELVSDVIGEQGGVRMTGGGFGGCVVCLLPESLCQSVINVIDHHYAATTGFSAEIHLCEASEGARQLSLTAP
ncbi:MAG: galactokinase [Pseudomonadota bacterium]